MNIILKNEDTEIVSELLYKMMKKHEIVYNNIKKIRKDQLEDIVLNMVEECLEISKELGPYSYKTNRCANKMNTTKAEEEYIDLIAYFLSYLIIRKNQKKKCLNIKKVHIQLFKEKTLSIYYKSSIYDCVGRLNNLLFCLNNKSSDVIEELYLKEVFESICKIGISLNLFDRNTNFYKFYKAYIKKMNYCKVRTDWNK